ncbi:translin-associated protein X [Fopius arisanus]|uniref:Translin-associated protein X n=1 Tax=Fopius arisanus TaxID=64838 RepID=A0A0C9RBQ5_9HYME|nr:PREDICTED: translin-associated protein X [Fopius arisanus]
MSEARNPSGAHRNRHHHHSTKQKINVGDKGREVLESIDEANPVIQQFRGYSLELDSKHDRYERIVKINRDITIESKRIIFLLHTIDKDSKRESILTEAKSRISTLRNSLFKGIACELEGQDPYQFLRAYRGGLQEFIEAVTFYHYLSDNSLPHWETFDQTFQYRIPETGESTPKDPVRTVRTLLPPTEYILGIADLTGELMRKCINNLASGDIASCFQTCNVVREMYKGFLVCYGIAGKEINQKVYTLKQSLWKMENVCYMIRVRGSEIPKHMLAEVAISAAGKYPTEDDEGYQGF